MNEVFLARRVHQPYTEYNKTRQGYARQRILKPAGYFFVLSIPHRANVRAMKRPFDKPATTPAQQLALLRQRGMMIDDEDLAIFYLRHINYYRLAAYWLPFEADHACHRLRPGTRFADVLNLYVFDRELRLLVLDAIERFEVSVRSQWAHHLAHAHGPHAHLDASLAFHQQRWHRNLAKLSKEIERSDETFIKHLRSKYIEPVPPLWAACEVMSLGLLSRWYDNLKPMPVRRKISAVYGLDEQVLASWLHHLSLVRNVCAHHARLWNRDFTVTPLLPRSKPSTLAQQLNPASRKLYNAMAILKYLMDAIAPAHRWHQRLMNLIDSHAIPTGAMGFPSEWRSLPIWTA